MQITSMSPVSVSNYATHSKPRTSTARDCRQRHRRGTVPKDHSVGRFTVHPIISALTPPAQPACAAGAPPQFIGILAEGDEPPIRMRVQQARDNLGGNSLAVELGGYLEELHLSATGPRGGAPGIASEVHGVVELGPSDFATWTNQGSPRPKGTRFHHRVKERFGSNGFHREKVGFRASEHLAFDHLDAVDVVFDRTAAPGQ